MVRIATVLGAFVGVFLSRLIGLMWLAVQTMVVVHVLQYLGVL